MAACQTHQASQQRRRDDRAGAEFQHYQPKGAAPGQTFGSGNHGAQTGDGNHRQRPQIDPTVGDVRWEEGVVGGGDPYHRLGGVLKGPDQGAGKGQMYAVGIGGELAQAAGELCGAPEAGFPVSRSRVRFHQRGGAHQPVM